MTPRFLRNASSHCGQDLIGHTGYIGQQKNRPEFGETCKLQVSETWTRELQVHVKRACKLDISVASLGWYWLDKIPICW